MAQSNRKLSESQVDALKVLRGGPARVAGSTNDFGTVRQVRLASMKVLWERGLVKSAACPQGQYRGADYVQITDAGRETLAALEGGEA